MSTLAKLGIQAIDHDWFFHYASPSGQSFQVSLAPEHQKGKPRALFKKISQLLALATIGKCSTCPVAFIFESGDLDPEQNDLNTEELKVRLTQKLLGRSSPEDQSAFHEWLWGDNAKHPDQLAVWLGTPWLGVLMDFKGTPGPRACEGTWNRITPEFARLELASRQGLLADDEPIGQQSIQNVSFRDVEGPDFHFSVTQIPLWHKKVRSFMSSLTGTQFAALLDSPARLPKSDDDADEAVDKMLDAISGRRLPNKAQAMIEIYTAIDKIGQGDETIEMSNTLIKDAVESSADFGIVIAELLTLRKLHDAEETLELLRTLVVVTSWLQGSGSPDPAIRALLRAMSVRDAARAISFVLDNRKPLNLKAWMHFANQWDTDFENMPIEFAFDLILGSDG